MTTKTLNSTTAPTTLLDALNPAFASRTAIIIPNGSTITYGQLATFVKELAGALQDALKLKDGDAVALSLVNGLEFTTAFLAVANIRCIAAPLNPNYTVEENIFYLTDTKCKCVIVHRGTAANSPVREAAKKQNVPAYELTWDSSANRLRLYDPAGKEVKGRATTLSPRPDDVCLILHTSGTTSRPKAVPLTHRNIATTVRNITATYRLQSSDRSLIVMPLFHVHGLIGVMLSTLCTGGSLVIPPKFSASTHWQQFDQYECTWYSAVPTIHQILVHNEYSKNKSPPSPVKKRPHLRFIRSCSSALAPATFHALEQLYGVPVIEAYAMTEAAHQMTSNNLPPGDRRAGSVGQGQGVQIAILDDNDNILTTGQHGEICARGDNITKGYINNPQANASSYTKNGWFRTGDQGYLDKDNFVYISGRLKELINRGGEKISPVEIDTVMAECPLVSEATAFPVHDDLYGQEVNAAVVLRNKVNNKTDEDKAIKEIQNYVKSKLAAFKVPKKIFITDAVPRTATGKIQRRHVAAAFEEKKKSNL